MTGKTMIAALLASVALTAAPALAQTMDAPETAPATSEAAGEATSNAPAAADATGSADTATGATGSSKKMDKRGWHGKKHGDYSKRSGMMRGVPPFFSSFDTDGDGTISADEAKAGVDQLIEKYGSEGAMDLDQFETMMTEITRPMTERMFKRLDSNNDGKIDQAEAEKTAERFSGARVWSPKADKAGSDKGAGEMAPSDQGSSSEAAPAPDANTTPAPAN